MENGSNLIWFSFSRGMQQSITREGNEDSVTSITFYFVNYLMSLHNDCTSHLLLCLIVGFVLLLQ